MSKITVTTIAGATSGADANKVKIESGDTLEVTSNATVGGTLGVTGTSTLTGNVSTNGQLGLNTSGTGVTGRFGTGITVRRAVPEVHLQRDDNQGEGGILLDNASSTQRLFVGTYNANQETHIGTNGTQRLVINNSGYITMPNQPAFRATPSGSTDLTSAGDIIFGDVSVNPDFNNGSHYNTSNGRFTCPVAGVYLFCFSAYKQTNQAAGDVNIRINGVGNGETRFFNSNGNHETMEGTFIFKLDANDYVNLYSEQPTLHLNPTMSFFSGYLLG